MRNYESSEKLSENAYHDVNNTSPTIIKNKSPIYDKAQHFSEQKNHKSTLTIDVERVVPYQSLISSNGLPSSNL